MYHTYQHDTLISMSTRHLTCVVALFLLCLQGLAQNDAQSVILHSTFRELHGPGELDRVWWITPGFWEAVWTAEGGITPAQQDFLLEFENVILIAVRTTDLQVALEKEWAYIQLDTSSRIYPRPLSSLSEPLIQFEELVTPMIRNVMEATESELVFYHFKIPSNLSAGWKRIFFRGGTQNHTWAKSQGQYLPTLRCPMDNAVMPSSWNYCPVHGNALVPRTSN